MTKEFEVYKCKKCGNIVQVMYATGPDISCCGEVMTLMTENTVDAAKEKHIPVIEKTDTGYKVAVGSVAHPMTAEHYIQWIELIADGKRYYKFLKPEETPEACFCTKATAVTARAYCNLHGLWKGQ